MSTITGLMQAPADAVKSIRHLLVAKKEIGDALPDRCLFVIVESNRPPTLGLNTDVFEPPLDGIISNRRSRRQRQNRRAPR